MSALPTIRGGWEVLYCDPPWAYNNKRTRSSAEKNYRTVSFDELVALPVHKIVAENCALFMWSTHPFTREAIELGESWGFAYKTAAFVWAKRNRVTNSAFFGMGNWTRANTEVCLLFTRGKPKRVSASVEQFYWGPILRHSEKPPEIRNRIVELIGYRRRLEMFSRVDAPGWQRWGNEFI